VVENQAEAGVSIFGSDGTIDGTTIRGTVANAEGLAGDGIILATSPSGGGNLTVTNTSIVESARAGVSAFGAPVSLGNVEISCSAFDLDQEELTGFAGSFVDLGSNACGCPEAAGGCTPVSSSIAAPTLDLSN
jgi:hypothetical protein